MATYKHRQLSIPMEMSAGESFLFLTGLFETSKIKKYQKGDQRNHYDGLDQTTGHFL